MIIVSRRFLVLLVVGVLLVATLVSLRSMGDDPRRLTAVFSRTTSLYEGARVKVLGVDVGRVESITVKGTSVEVEMTYDADVQLPDDVHALIVPPSIVGDRFVQLAPAYLGGEVLADGAELGLDRTGVPLELDDTYRGLDKLAAALGPEGANKDGALSRLVRATARNLQGHGHEFNTALRELAGAMSTLAASSDDVSDTVANLGTFSNTLATNDATMRALVTNLARVGSQLNGQRDDISIAVKDLRDALQLVGAFAEKHRAELKNTVDSLTDVSGVLARRTDELEELSDIAPVGLTSLNNIAVPRNFDPENVEAVPPGARTASQSLRGVLFDDLDVTLGFALNSICASMPAEQRAELAAFCTTLGQVGGDLGALLSILTGRGAGPIAMMPVPQSTNLGTLLTGGVS